MFLVIRLTRHCGYTLLLSVKPGRPFELDYLRNVTLDERHRRKRMSRGINMCAS